MTTDGGTLQRLGAGKYLLLTTYKRDGSTVPTPVWVVPDGNALGVWTTADSWKVKRIRNRADVLVAPCDVRGNRRGDDVPGSAEVLGAEATGHYRTLLARKYGLLGRLTLLGSRLRRGREGTVAIRIVLQGDAG
ncbi:PPOX class F420-dependent oxidoreductase [Peterkaempfera griseoplana]|uniref:PPOX class F420-dependent oxidoreductase n=1 Tax=Peterkaempfera griseoplana TaxID=66896 RepID=UPI0006E469D5|nr:PPOX class F420-dependent oxidoreductase [Peterkaempfera griseoplana]